MNRGRSKLLKLIKLMDHDQGHATKAVSFQLATRENVVVPDEIGAGVFAVFMGIVTVVGILLAGQAMAY